MVCSGNIIANTFIKVT